MPGPSEFLFRCFLIMAYKVLIVDDKQINKELINGLLDTSEVAAVFDGMAQPVTELIPKLKKAYEIIESAADI